MTLFVPPSVPQGRCTRENCKYLHPPAHLKTQLEINGRNNLIQQKTAAAMLAQQMQFVIPGTAMQPVVSAATTPLKLRCSVCISYFRSTSGALGNSTASPAAALQSAAIFFCVSIALGGCQV